MARLFLRVGVFYLRAGFALLGKPTRVVQSPLFLTTVHVDMVYRSPLGFTLEPWAVARGREGERA